MGKIGRNERCPCGSGKKFKHCHGKNGATIPIPSEQIKDVLRAHQAKEATRVKQQGLGRPIISTEFQGHRIVAVKDKLHASKSWKFFTDFLADYIKVTLGGDWGNAEIKKPFKNRHPLMQWYDAYCRLQQRHAKKAGEPYSAEITGVVYCYLGLAYNLYLIRHNVKLQGLYVERLKVADQFQSAYHELMIANILIRAGFELELEDETDRRSKHCEFSASSIRTGKKYSVEAKMRSERDTLAKRHGKRGGDPTARLIKHVNAALAKPAVGERLIFVDVNTDPIDLKAFAEGEEAVPRWVTGSENKLENLERRIGDDVQAYVFVTNMSFHRSLEDSFLGQILTTYGLGIPDFAKPIYGRPKEVWKKKQKHIDMEYIKESIRTYPKIPNHFEGDLPSVEDGARERIRIGGKYDFVDAGVRGVVTSATVFESKKQVYVGVHTDDGKGVILREPMSDYEIKVYRDFPDTYFGVVQEVSKNYTDPFEFYERMVEIHRSYPRENILRMAKDAPDIDYLTKLDDLDLVLEFCERLSNNVMRRSKDKGAPGVSVRSGCSAVLR
jgi:hypothetical protein